MVKLFHQGDVCLNTDTQTLWWIGGTWTHDGKRDWGQLSEPVLTGHCILGHKEDGWDVGSKSPFDNEPYDEVTVLAHGYDHEQALAVAQLVGADGFVKEPNNVG